MGLPTDNTSNKPENEADRSANHFQNEMLSISTPALKVQRLENLLESGEAKEVASYGQISIDLSRAHIQRTDFKSANEALHRGLSVVRKAGNKPLEVELLKNIASVMLHQGRVDDALSILRTLMLGGQPTLNGYQLRQIGYLLAKAFVMLNDWPNSRLMAEQAHKIKLSLTDEELCHIDQLDWLFSLSINGYLCTRPRDDIKRELEIAQATIEKQSAADQFMWHSTSRLVSSEHGELVNLYKEKNSQLTDYPLVRGRAVLMTALAVQTQSAPEEREYISKIWDDLHLASLDWPMKLLLSKWKAMATCEGEKQSSTIAVPKCSKESQEILQLLRVRYRTLCTVQDLKQQQLANESKKNEIKSISARSAISENNVPSLLSELIRVRIPKLGQTDVLDLGKLGFSLLYQPFFEPKSNTVVGCEALIRLNHPSSGPLGPNQFIGRLEGCGDIVEVGRWVLLQACLQIKTWELSLQHPIKVAVNVALRQLEEPGLSDFLWDLVQHSRIRPEALEIEITESLALKNSECVLNELKKINDMGIGISMDDYGTGFCNITRVLELRAQKLKIDKSLIDRIALGEKDRRIIGTLISSGKSLDMTVTAEGVETKAQMALLSELGCNYLQGYLFGKPMSPMDIEKLFQRSPESWKQLLISA